MFLIFFQLRIPNEHFTNQYMCISSGSIEGELYSLEKTMTNTQKTISNQKNSPILALTLHSIALFTYALLYCTTLAVCVCPMGIRCQMTRQEQSATF